MFVFYEHCKFFLKMRFFSANAYTKQDIKLASQPRGMAIFKEDGTIITASINEITVIQDNKKASVMKVDYEPSSVSVSQENHVAVGGKNCTCIFS